MGFTRYAADAVDQFLEIYTQLSGSSAWNGKSKQRYLSNDQPKSRVLGQTVPLHPVRPGVRRTTEKKRSSYGIELWFWGLQ